MTVLKRTYLKKDNPEKNKSEKDNSGKETSEKGKHWKEKIETKGSSGKRKLKNDSFGKHLCGKGHF